MDVLKGNVASRISSKDLLNKGVLGWWGKEVVLFKESEVFLMISGVSKDFTTGIEDGGWGCTGDNILGAVRDVKEGIVLNVFEDRPDKLRGLRDNGLEGTGSDVERAWIVPSVVRALKDLKDGGGGICNILLIDVVKGRPGSDRDMGKGGGGNGGGLGRVERHSILN